MPGIPQNLVVPVEPLVAFASDLIAITTANPPGAAYADCVARIAQELDHLSLRYDIIETGEPQNPRQVVVARPNAAGRPLYLHGHYDVVPAFAPDQFHPRLQHGRLIGRGASDMKGGLASIVYAARICADRGLPVALMIVPDEETGGRLGAERLDELGLIDRTAVGAIAAEPTWGTVWHACRGAFTLWVTVRGRSAHVGLHYQGRNAFTDAVRIVEALEPLQRRLTNRLSAVDVGSDDPAARQSIMLIGGRAEGGVNFNIVPDQFAFTIDRRPNADENYDEARSELVDVLEQVRRHGAIDVEWDVIQDASNGATAPDDPFAVAVAAAVERQTQQRPKLTCCPGVLETRVYQRLGIPAVAFGPGRIDRMHSADEDVPVANLAAAAAVYVDVATSIASRRRAVPPAH